MIRFGWRAGLIIAVLFAAGIALILSGLFSGQESTPMPGGTTTIITPGPVVTILKPGPTVTAPGTITKEKTTTNRTTTTTTTRVSPGPTPPPSPCRPGPPVLGGNCP